MATIVTRAGKGSPLTNTEVDANFTNLNNDKLEDITGESIKDLSDVNSGMTPTDGQLLTWDNANTRWSAADAPVSLPDQTGNSGKYLTTDGTTASWASVTTNRYETITVSANRTLDANAEYFAGSGTTINDGVTLTIPDSTLLDIKLYQVGKAL